MATIVLRTVKGTPLTNLEVDGNFSNINTELGVVFNRANTINSNVIAIANDVSNIQASLSTLESVAISNANSEVRVTSANGSIFANVNSIVAISITENNGNANVRVHGALQDGTGRTLRILNESNVVIWGN